MAYTHGRLQKTEQRPEPVGRTLSVRLASLTRLAPRKRFSYAERDEGGERSGGWETGAVAEIEKSSRGRLIPAPDAGRDAIRASVGGRNDRTQWQTRQWSAWLSVPEPADSTRCADSSCATGSAA